LKIQWLAGMIAGVLMVVGVAAYANVYSSVCQPGETRVEVGGMQMAGPSLRPPASLLSTTVAAVRRTPAGVDVAALSR